MLRFGSSLCLQRQQQEHYWDDNLEAVKVCEILDSISEVEILERQSTGVEKCCSEYKCYNVIDELQGSVSSEVGSEDASPLQCMGGSYV